MMQGDIVAGFQAGALEHHIAVFGDDIEIPAGLKPRAIDKDLLMGAREILADKPKPAGGTAAHIVIFAVFLRQNLNVPANGKHQIVFGQQDGAFGCQIAARIHQKLVALDDRVHLGEVIPVGFQMAFRNIQEEPARAPRIMVDLRELHRLGAHLDIAPGIDDEVALRRNQPAQIAEIPPCVQADITFRRLNDGRRDNALLEMLIDGGGGGGGGALAENPNCQKARL